MSQLITLIWSLTVLSMALEEFPGTVILVSHDRQLVSSLATHIIELKGSEGYNYYQGNYEDYLSSQGL